MPEFGFDLDEIRRLIHLVERRGLAKLEVEEEDRRVVIRGPRPRRRPRPGPETEEPDEFAATSEAEPAPPATRAPIPVLGRVAVVAPTVGVFYRAAAVDAPPLVEVGDHVDVGQPIGLLEAMKVFSEILSDHAGTVTEIIARNGALVREGDPLLYLKED